MYGLSHRSGCVGQRSGGEPTQRKEHPSPIQLLTIAPVGQRITSNWIGIIVLPLDFETNFTIFRDVRQFDTRLAFTSARVLMKLPLLHLSLSASYFKQRYMPRQRITPVATFWRCDALVVSLAYFIPLPVAWLACRVFILKVRQESSGCNVSSPCLYLHVCSAIRHVPRNAQVYVVMRWVASPARMLFTFEN